MLLFVMVAANFTACDKETLVTEEENQDFVEQATGGDDDGGDDERDG